MIRILFMLAVCLSSCSQARVPESTPCKLHPNFNFLNYYMVSCFEEQHFKDEIKAVYDRALKRKQDIYIVDMQLVEKGKSLKPFLSPYGLRSQGKYGLAPYNALFIFQGNTLDAQYFLTYD